MTSKSKHGKLHNLIFILLAAVMLGGCALGTTELKIAHNDLDQVSHKREGNLLVKEFTDSRKDTTYIGNKRNGFGMVLGHVGLPPDKKLETILTGYFAEALQDSGYQVTILDASTTDKITPEQYDAIIEGDILDFWMDLYMAVWHRVKVDIKAIDPADEKIIWEHQIAGDEKRTLWVGATGEYERIIREAITKTLNTALEDFTSDEFYTAIKQP